MSIHPLRQGELVDKPSTLALAKFSYATTSTERAAPVNWTHLAGDTNLFVVFERVRICGSSIQNTHERRLLKVQKGPDTLEELDLNSLVDEAAERAKSLQLQNSKPTVAVIVKSPCLAVRYPAQNNQVRRFQIKFNSEADYYKALAILSELGCPITESAAGPYQQHISRSISSSSQVPPSPSVSTAPHHLNGPLALPSLLNFQEKPASSSPVERHSVSHAEDRIRGSVGEGSGRRNFCEADNDDTHVSTVSSASSATACDLRTERKHLSLPHRTQASSHALPSNTQQRFFSDLSPPSRGPERQTQPPSLTSPASPTIQNPELLGQILPPKRELPFAKPAAKKPCSSVQKTPKKACTSSRTSPTRSVTSGIQMSEPACSQEAKTARTGGNQNTINESGALHPQRPQENNTFPRPFSRSKGLQPSQRTTPFEQLAPGGQPSLPNSNLQTPNSLNAEQAPFPANSHQNSMNIQERPIPTSVATNNNNPPPTHPQVTQSSNPTPLPQSRNAGNITSSDLSSYLQTPTPERSALIESWVCQQLQDDGFLTLCEDMEGVWRRIAFGR